MRAKATGQHEAEEGSRKPDDSHGLSWLATGFADRLTTSTNEPESDGLLNGFMAQWFRDASRNHLTIEP